MIYLPTLPTITDKLQRKTVAGIHANMLIMALNMDGIIVVLIVAAVLTIGKKVQIIEEVSVSTQIMCIILYLQLILFRFINLDWETSLAGSFTVVSSTAEEANITGLDEYLSVHHR
jgi:membrane glycosyltransferase